MKIESIGTMMQDPVRTEKSGTGSAATAQTSLKNNPETAQLQKPLQDESRSAEELQQDINTVNDQLKSKNRSIRFSVDNESDDVVVKVVDKDTGDVVMQIPPEEVVKLRERLSEMSGLLVEKQV